MKNNSKTANINFNEWLVEQLRDPEEARVFLETVLEEHEEDPDDAVLLDALRSVAEAQGGLGELAKRTKLNRQNLYKALSKTGKPKLETVCIILRGLGFRLGILPLETKTS